MPDPEGHVGVITRDDIEAGLSRLGVGPGDKVMVHSSLSSFGHVAGPRIGSTCGGGPWSIQRWRFLPNIPRLLKRAT